MDIDSLMYDVALQNGTSTVGDEEWEQFDREAERVGYKVKWGRGVDFGSPVVVLLDEGEGFDPVEEFGYLTCLPGHHDPDMDGIIHLPHTHGNGEDGGPIWMTIVGMAMLPDVLEIRIGGTDGH